MKDLDKVLVDTSGWIDFFRKKEPVYSTVLKLIDENRICCIGLILAELIQGAKTREEIATLKDFIDVFDFVGESNGLWEQAGELSFSLKRVGKQVGLADCYIATIAYVKKAAILTLDKHFRIIAEQIELVLL